MEEVVGDIREEEDEVRAQYTDLGEGAYLVDVSVPLDEFSELVGVELEDNEHETIAGFFIEHTNKVPQKGDHLTVDGIVFTVEEVDGKRASSLHVRILKRAEQESTG